MEQREDEFDEWLQVINDGGPSSMTYLAPCFSACNVGAPSRVPLLLHLPPRSVLPLSGALAEGSREERWGLVNDRGCNEINE